MQKVFSCFYQLYLLTITCVIPKYQNFVGPRVVTGAMEVLSIKMLVFFTKLCFFFLDEPMNFVSCNFSQTHTI